MLQHSPFHEVIQRSGFREAGIIGDLDACEMTPYLRALGLKVTQTLGREESSGALKDPRFMQLPREAHEVLVLGAEFSDDAQYNLDSLNRITAICLQGLKPRAGLCILARREKEPSIELLSMMRQNGFRALTVLTPPETQGDVPHFYQVYQRV